MRKVSKLCVLLVAVLTVVSGSVSAYTYNPSDFATEVVEYVEGTGVGSDWISGEKFNNPACALGRPTVDTTGDGWYIPVDETVPVVPVYPSFRSFELVTIGNGGSLTVKFDHRVLDDPDNPYGLDLIVFGNAFQIIGGGQGWTNGDPNDVTVSGNGFVEPGIVSVSQDGQTWYTLSNGPFADDFAPTLGRVYDPANPDKSIGDWNNWWGEPTDPRIPLDPSLDFSSFEGWTVAQIAQAYGESAGGAGIDIGQFALPIDENTGLKWVQYVRIDDNPDSSATTEIDAIADAVALIPGDANIDGVVDVADLGILAGNYENEEGMTWSDGDFTHDGAVDVADLGILASNYGYGCSGVPEPATIALLIAGGVGLLFRRR